MIVELSNNLQSNQLEQIYKINQDCIPAVGSETIDNMKWLLDHANYKKVLLLNNEIAGFLIGMGPSLDYQSENYKWFNSRFDNFFYVDRIAITSSARRQGFGQVFYKDIEKFCKDRFIRIALEVNIKPENTPSLNFHKQLGYYGVGEQKTDGGKKTVSLMVKDLQ